MNTTSWLPLNGTSTLLAVHQNPTGFAPDGAGLGAGDQLLVTEDSIQVLDLRVVRVLIRIYVSGSLTRA
jgi:iron transport multicopper oxidase